MGPMSTFRLNCPNCGIVLEADEKNIGARAACSACNHHFILKKHRAPSYPDALEDIKVEELASAGINLLFSRNTFSESTLEELQSLERTKELFGFEWPLLIKKQRGTFEMPIYDGRIRHWKKTISALGSEFFLCNQWDECHRNQLISWFQDQGITYEELRHKLGASDEDTRIVQSNNVEGRNNVENSFELHRVIDRSIQQLSFSLNAIPDDLTYTKPYKLSYFEEDYELSSWKDLLREVCKLLDDKFHKRLLALRGKSFTEFTKRICLRSSKHNLLQPLKITDDLWLESNFDAKTIVRFVTVLSQKCEIEPANIKVYYHSPLENKGSHKESKIAGKNNSFTKKLDWSTLTQGVTIPIKLHDIFLQHLSVSLPRGNSVPVFVCIEEKRYHASILNVGFSDSTRKQVIQILWSRKSPIAKMLRMKFPGAYQQLELDHSNRDGINVDVTVACNSAQDEFKLSFSKTNQKDDITLVESKSTAARIGASPSINDAVNTQTVCSKSRKDSSPRLEVSIQEKQSNTLQKHFVDPLSRDEIKQKIYTLLSGFRNGFRPTSPIDMNRFKRSWEKQYGIPLPQDIDDKILLVCEECCANLNEKFYVITDIMKAATQTAIETGTAKGLKIFFFNELFDRFSSDFLAAGIVNADLLREVVSRSFPDFSCEELKFTIEDDVSVESELDRVMSELCVASTKTLAAKFPYVPIQRIKTLLCTNPQKYVRNGRNEFAYLPLISFDGADIADAFRLIEAGIHKSGFSSTRHFNVSRSFALNTGISEIALRTGLFDQFLSGLYSRTRSIITVKGETLSDREIFLRFCRSHNSFTLCELNDLETEVTGRCANCALAAALEVSVRLDHNNFSALDSIHFNAEAIDNAIDTVFGDRATTLLSIQDFSFLPPFESIAWNHYLLESFVRHFSHHWHFISPGPNNSRIGIIYPKTAKGINYECLAAEILRRAGAKNLEDVKQLCQSLGIFARLTSKVATELASHLMVGIS